MAKRLLRYQETTLPSGLKIRGVQPTAQEMIRRGIWPKDLRVQLFLGGATASEEDEDALKRLYVESQHVTIAAYVRQEWDVDNDRWEPVEYTPAEVHDFAPEDLDALEDIVLRRKTPAQVTAETLERAGTLEPELAAKIVEGEAAATVTGWAEFRGDERSVTPSEDSGDVEDEAVGTAASGGRRGRAGAGRGTRNPAVEG